MKRLVLAVLLTVLQAIPPVVGQAPATPDKSSRKGQEDGKGNKNTSAPLVPTKKPETPPGANSDGPKITPKDTEYSVKLTGSPVVTIAGKNKTILDYVFDWGPWVFALCLVVVGIAQTVTMIWQARLLRGTMSNIQTQANLMEGQLTEMQAASQQAARHLGLTERPWLSPSAKLAGPLTATDADTRITLLVEVANVGKSPAIGIEINPIVYLMHIDRPGILQELKRIRDETIGRSVANPNFGHMLFPTGTPLAQRWTISTSAADIEKYSSEDGFYCVQIVLCVAYRSTIDEAARHCTAFVYDLHRIDPEYPVGNFSLRKGESVPAGLLKLAMSPYLAPIVQ